MMCLHNKTYCCYDTVSKFEIQQQKSYLANTRAQRRSIPQNFRTILDNTLNTTSTKRSFRSRDHTVATNEQTEQGNFFVLNQLLTTMKI